MTLPECWSDHFSFSECCPNADCWDDATFTYDGCCSTAKFGARGNVGCWSEQYTYEHCCLANSSAQSWVDVFIGDASFEQFYGLDEFYTDAQYGEDFGYYSTGRVLRSGGAKRGDGAQEFAHYTTYPMALAPHFGRVACRSLFLMWIHMDERAPFRVVEMGAGSGQLAEDIHRCVRANELGIAPPVWRRWVAAFEYLIIERSPALAKRQRQRGLRVVSGDAQTSATGGPALAALAASDACSAVGGHPDAPECAVVERGTSDTGASVVLSNELLDAFAPLKLRLSVYEDINVTDCRAWQEVRLAHLIAEEDLRQITQALQYAEDQTEALLTDLYEHADQVFCRMANSTIGRAARQSVPESSCLALVFGLSELMYHADMQLPSASHNMRLRLRKDRELAERLRDVVAKLDDALYGRMVLPRPVYQQLRHQLRDAPNIEVVFLSQVQTRHIVVPIPPQRCDDLAWWMDAHQERVARLADLYRSLGYPGISFLVRPGERDFVELADCLMGPTGGFALSIDYGASFEALGHSLSVDPGSDGIFIPPIPQELLDGLPDCYGSWPTCAGRVDLTTFVDFTNVAAAGERLGWRTLFYGPQSLLEHIGRRNMTIAGKSYQVPGYSVLAGSWASRHVQSWYGREASKVESDGNWQQRWTSFKMLLLEKPADPLAPKPSIIAFPSWHLDAEEAGSCWSLDPSALPLADWVRRQRKDDPRQALEMLTEEVNDGLGREYAEAYEEAQLAVRMVYWLVATEGCENFRPARAATLLNSRGLWRSLLRRLLRAWEGVWGAEALERVALAVLRRLAERPEDEEGRPFECLGQQTYVALCEDPGDGSQARAPTYAQS